MQKIISKNKTLKFISAFLIVSILMPSVLLSIPQQAEAQAATDTIGGPSNILTAIEQAIGNLFADTGTTSTVTNTGISIKNVALEILRQALMAVARKALQQITKSITNWIKGGFHGSPLYLENPGSFFKDIAKSEVKMMVDLFGYDSLKYPFGKQFALNTINSYKSTLENNASYSLSSVMTDPVLLKNYQNNFNVGGWNGFLINTQYPQNNYLGFQMIATEELARRVQGTAQTALDKVKDTLAQGQGFLSPQICDPAVNPNYNNMVNEFQKPNFNGSEYDNTHPFEPPAVGGGGLDSDGNSLPTNPDDQKVYDAYVAQYNKNKTAEKSAWEEKNTCVKKDGTSGLINTTPGTVVANQITTALNIPANSTLQAMGLGNSLSAIFDALLNKFLGDGLSALASTANPAPAPDNWSYAGQTLGSPATNANGNTDVFNGPDEVIDLTQFKQAVADGIINTQEEIKLMDNYDSQDPQNLQNRPDGIVQLMTKIPGQAQNLDKCLPGPDKGWEDRLTEEQNRVSKKLSQEESNDDQTKVKAATDAIRELKFAVDSFKDWMTTKIMNSLPGAVLYLDAVKKIDDFPQQQKETTDTRRAKSQTLARLQAIQKSLSLITRQPASTDANFTTQENNLVTIKKQYDALKPSISSSISIEDTRNQLNTLKDQFSNLVTLNTQCQNERVAAGWGPTDTTGNGNSVLASAVGKMITITRVASSTDSSIVGGLTDFFTGGALLGGIFGGSGGISTAPVKIQYKTTGTESEQFCGLPIISGYSHGEVLRQDTANFGQTYTFRNLDNNNGSPGYEDVPIVNAQNIYGDITCTGLCSLPGSSGPLANQTDKRISIDIDCHTVFKSNKIDYTHAGDPNF